ncbi:DUF2690 domain-containing protein [Amycolatopsis vastitatis]|uniref:DUF2690 domain-containing protein n=1 Tax=Amycolatopsis vastitatis TaxID=1905142 RepID=A0A229SRE6_9PSEU|nr:DUF2690 domain-containing protein [Amycolatopsis vastitatis]OXM61189.1 hypothetical protein CF165_39785 [Amycolatopsis vastitatis]
MAAISPASSSATTMSLNQPGDGLDPAAAGCSGSAVTADGATVRTPYGTLELRWSETCLTNWGRFLPSRSGFRFAVWVHRQEDNQSCGDHSGNGCASQLWDAPTVAYSNQLYECNYHMQAEVTIFDGANPALWYVTPYIGGC